jgi:hypothetical protein
MLFCPSKQILALAGMQFTPFLEWPASRRRKSALQTAAIRLLKPAVS